MSELWDIATKAAWSARVTALTATKENVVSHIDPCGCRTIIYSGRKGFDTPVIREKDYCTLHGKDLT